MIIVDAVPGLVNNSKKFMSMSYLLKYMLSSTQILILIYFLRGRNRKALVNARIQTPTASHTKT